MAMDYVLGSLEFLFYTMTNFIQLEEEWIYTLFVITTADDDEPLLKFHRLDW